MTPEQLEQYRADAMATDADDGDAMLALLGEIERLTKEKDKWYKFYKMAIEEHMSLGEEMTLRRKLKEAEEEVGRLRRTRKVPPGQGPL